MRFGSFLRDAPALLPAGQGSCTLEWHRQSLPPFSRLFPFGYSEYASLIQPTLSPPSSTDPSQESKTAANSRRISRMASRSEGGPEADEAERSCDAGQCGFAQVVGGSRRSERSRRLRQPAFGREIGVDGLGRDRVAQQVGDDSWRSPAHAKLWARHPNVPTCVKHDTRADAANGCAVCLVVETTLLFQSQIGRLPSSVCVLTAGDRLHRGGRTVDLQPAEEFGQARMPAPPEAVFLERKLGQTLLPGV